MRFIKNNARLIISVALSLAIGLGAGVLIAPREAAAVPEAPLENAQPVSQGEKPSILPETAVEVQYRFLLCGHTIEREETGGAFSGLTLDEVRKTYPDVRAAALEGNTALIERELECYCPAHYVLFSDELGHLLVSHTTEPDFEEDVMTLKYDPTGLPSDVQVLLEEGIDFSSLEEINAYLEDVES